ncbi:MULTISPECIES: DUF3429 domain-containing protein [Nisaea]|uniref:DUF3429 domain-containing protein n=1 Tax=Nisaea TaxID=390876 RepID=UPI0004055B21|nr:MULTISPECIES: DUF3429 domain-containing protein [Nisaea]
MLPSFQDVPRPALILGLGGLVPFYAISLPVWLTDPLYSYVLIDSLITYGAAILSFLGAVHWGAAMWQGELEEAREEDDEEMDRAAWARYGWSVVPALIAWIGTLLGPFFGLVLITLGIAFAYFIDVRACNAGFLPEWYAKLRKWLTIFTLIALANAGIGGAVVPY